MTDVEWDEVKDAENSRLGRPPLRYGALVFDGDYVEEQDDRMDYGEARFRAIGPIADFGGRRVRRRIISFRKANDREVREYQANVA